jgi:hypothetical protein
LINIKDEASRNLRKSITFLDENDFQRFLRDIGGYAIENLEGNSYRALALIDAEKKYNICYCEKAAARFDDGFRSNSAKAFEAKANVAVVDALCAMGHQSVELLHAAKEMSYAGSTGVKGEIDGLIATASHLFVVEAKLHAKVAIAPRIRPASTL